MKRREIEKFYHNSTNEYTYVITVKDSFIESIANTVLKDKELKVFAAKDQCVFFKKKFNGNFFEEIDFFVSIDFQYIVRAVLLDMTGFKTCQETIYMSHWFDETTITIVTNRNILDMAEGLVDAMRNRFEIKD